jgi:hypothetical protein
MRQSRVLYDVETCMAGAISQISRHQEKCGAEMPVGPKTKFEFTPQHFNLSSGSLARHEIPITG